MSTLVLGVWVFCVMVCLMRDVKSELFTYVVSLISSLSIMFVLRKNVYHDKFQMPDTWSVVIQVTVGGTEFSFVSCHSPGMVATYESDMACSLTSRDSRQLSAENFLAFSYFGSDC